MSLSIYELMTQLARKHSAIDMTVGYTDFPVNGDLIALVRQKIQEGVNQYSTVAGSERLREYLARDIKARHGTEFNRDDEITITAGATEAIFCAIASVVSPGDEVIVFEPSFDSYVPTVEFCGGKVKPIYLDPTSEGYPWTTVKDTISERTRLIILNSPHNPTGTLLSSEDMQTLRSLTHGTDIYILSDEVYAHMVFDGHKHLSVLDYEDLAERSFVVYSFGKKFYATGWKLGYCVAPKRLTDILRTIHQLTVFSVNTPIQHALADFLQTEIDLSGVANQCQLKRDIFTQGLAGSRFSFIPTKSTVFQVLTYEGISDEPDVDFAHRLVIESGVAAVPLSPLCRPNSDVRALRFCFARSDNELEQAVKRLCAV